MKQPFSYILISLGLFISGISCGDKNAEYADQSPAYFSETKMAGGAGEADMASSLPNPEVKLQRMIIKEAEIYLEVSAYDKVVKDIQSLVNQKGGYVVSTTVETGAATSKYGQIVLRVPAPVFEDVLGQLRSLALKVTSETIRGNDVTEEYYDLEARLSNKRKVEQRFQEILKTAKTTAEILEVESALGNIREEIDRMEGRRRFLQDQVQMSTITAHVQEPGVGAYSGEGGFWQKIGDGFRRGIDGFGDVLGGSITFVIATIPIWVLVIVVWFVLRILVRKIKSKKAKIQP